MITSQYITLQLFGQETHAVYISKFRPKQR